MAEQKFDVLVSGAGPVGLILTYQLARLGVSTCIIDAADKASPAFRKPIVGASSLTSRFIVISILNIRADFKKQCMAERAHCFKIEARTLDMLDQLDLFQEMAQTGLVSNCTVKVKEGKRVPGRDMHNTALSGTFFDFWMNIRLKYSEDIFRKRVAKLGSKVQAPVRLVDLSLDEKASDDYKVTSTCTRPDGTSFRIKSKYIVGCDGGSSAVRNLANIPFIGANKEDHWVRIDGTVKTNIPDSRLGTATIDSKTHGSVLVAALDHGATRIGYALTPEMYAKYGRKMKQEDAIKEAKAAVAPCALEFEHVDWHTVYNVKQFVAERFQDRERILLAGDAAHAHSSGTAQGMNTGCHDVVSLAWRLAGVLNDVYKPEVLANYSDERREIAKHLIENDKVIAALLSGHKPERYKDRPEDPLVLADDFIRGEWAFTMGLGVNYPPNLLNVISDAPPPFSVAPGHPAPDVSLHRQGVKGFPIRLHEVTKYNGKFHILVFSGLLSNTRGLLKKLRGKVDRDGPRLEPAVEFRTIICGAGSVFAEYLGVEQFGDAYWDIDHTAHEQFKVSLETGVMAVIRPDGILGFVAALDDFESVTAYLDRLVVRREIEVVTNGIEDAVGEMINPEENNLYYTHSNAQDVPQSHEEGIVHPQSAKVAT